MFVFSLHLFPASVVVVSYISWMRLLNYLIMIKYDEFH